MRPRMWAGVLATLLVVTPVGSAMGSIQSGTSGNVTVWYGPTDIYGSSNGVAKWNAGTDYLDLTANPFGMASGRCLTTWFDWSVSSGHYDA